MTSKQRKKIRDGACGHAHDALAGYVARDPYEMDKKFPVSDLLTDLMHFCRFEKVDFDDALRMAKENFEAEKP